MNEELRNQINALIVRLRQGDRDAEEKLNGRYVPKIRFYVHNNVWHNDIKDPENLVQDIWLKLRTWFNENFIKESEKNCYIQSGPKFLPGTSDKRQTRDILRRRAR